MASIDIKISGQNLLPFSGMEDWVGGASAAPTEHVLTGTSASVARSTTVKFGTYSAAVTRAGNDATLYYALANFDEYAGRKMTFGAWVKASVASRARIAINDGVGVGASAYHSGGNDWEFLTVTLNISPSATKIWVEMHVNSGNTTAYFDSGILCDGASTFTDLTAIADWSNRRVSNRFASQSYEVPRRDGQKTPNARLQSKALTFDAMVIGATPEARRTNMDLLQAALACYRKTPSGDVEQKQIYFYDDRYFNALVDQIDPEETAASRISKVRVRFDIGDPFEYAVNKTRVSQAISGTTTFTMTNAGTAMVFPIISLTNSSSAITSLTIENLTTGQKVSYSGTLSTSDILKIDTENLTVENDGVNDLGNVTNEIGVQLAPGGNEIRVTGMAAGTAIVDFRNRWY